MQHGAGFAPASIGDTVSCGRGDDTALVDPGDTVARGCEHVNP